VPISDLNLINYVPGQALTSGPVGLAFARAVTILDLDYFIFKMHLVYLETDLQLIYYILEMLVSHKQISKILMRIC
jgi:hypothetical protein